MQIFYNKINVTIKKLLKKVMDFVWIEKTCFFVALQVFI